jgi:Ca2+-binding RTX toxin-like protein
VDADRHRRTNELFGGYTALGPATIRGGAGDDDLMGTRGADTIDGGPGQDRVVSNGRVEDDVTGVEEFDEPY